MRQTANGAWRLVISLPPDPVTGTTRRQLVRTVRGSKTQARAALNALLAERGTGRLDGSAITVAGLVGEWLDNETELSPTTKVEYQRMRRWLQGPFGQRPAAKVTVAEVRDLYRHLAKDGVSPWQVQQLHKVLSRAFNLGMRWEWLPRNPVALASPPPAKGKATVMPSDDDVRRLLAAAGHDFGTWLRVSAATGMRRGEVCGLQWGDVSINYYVNGEPCPTGSSPSSPSSTSSASSASPLSDASSSETTTASSERSLKAGSTTSETDANTRSSDLSTNRLSNPGSRVAGTIRVQRAVIVVAGSDPVVKGTKTNRARVFAIDETTCKMLDAHRLICIERAMMVDPKRAEPLPKEGPAGPDASRRQVDERGLATTTILHPAAFVFSMELDGSKPWRPDLASHRFDRLRKRLGINVPLKSLRHDSVSYLLSEGADPNNVANRHGHARTSMTLDVYGHAVPARDRDLADLVGRRLDG